MFSFFRSSNTEQLFQDARDLTKAGRHAEAESVWQKCAQSADWNSIEGLTAQGMTWYNKAPDGSEHGAATEYREALKSLGRAVLKQGQRADAFDPVAMWYLGDTAAKLGTGFAKSHKPEHRLWRRCALQCYARVFASIAQREEATAYWDQDATASFVYRFRVTRKFHEDFGMDSGDLRVLGSKALDVTQHLYFHKELMAVLAYLAEHKASPANIAYACVQSVGWIEDLSAVIADALNACDGTVRPALFGRDVLYAWAWRMMQLTAADPGSQEMLKDLFEGMLMGSEGLGGFVPPSSAYGMRLQKIAVATESQAYHQMMVSEMFAARD